MRSLMFLCFVLVGVTTAYGQSQQASVSVNGGRVVGVFVPDGQSGPVPDPAFGQSTQQQVVPHQHAGNCGCPVCRRRVLSQNTQVFERSKTIREYTEIKKTVVEEEHPPRTFSPQPSCPAPQRDPCPPRNPCAQPHGPTGLVPWNYGFAGYRQQCPPRGWGGPVAQTARPIAGFGVNVFGIGGSVAVTKSSGARYAGDPGYGGFGYPSQPVRQW